MGKRSADAEPEAKAEADPYYGYGVPWLSGVFTAVLHFSTTSSNLQNFLPSSSVWPRPTHLLGGVEAHGVHDVSKVEHVKLALAIPVIDVTDLLTNVSVNHFVSVGRMPLLTWQYNKVSRSPMYSAL